MEFIHRVGPEADASMELFGRLARGKVDGEVVCPGCFIIKLPHLMCDGYCTDCRGVASVGSVRLADGEKE